MILFLLQLLSHASCFAVIPDAVRKKVDIYGLGLLSKWSPQQTILSHPVRTLDFFWPGGRLTDRTEQVTGWFVTHGGQNSILEAITAGIPM